MESKPVIKQPNEEAKEVLYQRLLKNAGQSGYFLNPDKEYDLFLINGLLVNEGRYGYPSCPCRLSTGIREKDLDLVCPCDYRDADLSEYGMCYCSLYVSKDVAEGRKQTASIPERRQTEAKPAPASIGGQLSLPVWRCKVCGYLCAREAAPDLCPICQADKERFERFI
jgi:ferredoxin-thioredoxin reductase catalytic subunit